MYAASSPFKHPRLVEEAASCFEKAASTPSQIDGSNRRKGQLMNFLVLSANVKEQLIVLFGIIAFCLECSAQLQPQRTAAAFACAGSSISSCEIVNSEDVVFDGTASVNGNLGSSNIGVQMTVNALGESVFGTLRSRVTNLFQVSTTPVVVVAGGQATFKDVITIDVPSMRGEVGLLQPQYALSGIISAGGSARAFAEITVVGTNNPRFSVLKTSSTSGLFLAPPIRFVFGQPFALFFGITTVAGTASPNSNGIGFVPFKATGLGRGEADFSNTLTLTALEVFDGAGKPLPVPPVFTSASGTSYSIDGVLKSFEHFSAHAEVEPAKKEFEVNGSFLLASNSTGIDPINQEVSLQVGPFSTIIPAGSFRKQGSGSFHFEGIVNGVQMQVSIRSTAYGDFRFRAKGRKADLVGTTEPLTIRLIVGDNGGKATVEDFDDGD